MEEVTPSVRTWKLSLKIVSSAILAGVSMATFGGFCAGTALWIESFFSPWPGLAAGFIGGAIGALIGAAVSLFSLRKHIRSSRVWLISGAIIGSIVWGALIWWSVIAAQNAAIPSAATDMTRGWLIRGFLIGGIGGAIAGSIQTRNLSLQGKSSLRLWLSASVIAWAGAGLGILAITWANAWSLGGGGNPGSVGRNEFDRNFEIAKLFCFGLFPSLLLWIVGAAIIEDSKSSVEQRNELQPPEAELPAPNAEE